MDRIIEEHAIGRHMVAVVEQVMDEGIGYLLLVDGVPLTDEPLNTPPSAEQITALLRSQGLG